MKKAYNNQWILLFALAAFWVLIIQVVPRFLPFNFGRVMLLGVNIHTDYLTHILLFTAIVLIVNTLHLKIKWRYLLPIYIIVAVFAEVVQVYIPKRTFNYWDLVSNIAGVIIGVAVVWGMEKIKVKG